MHVEVRGVSPAGEPSLAEAVRDLGYSIQATENGCRAEILVHDVRDPGLRLGDIALRVGCERRPTVLVTSGAWPGLAALAVGARCILVARTERSLEVGLRLALTTCSGRAGARVSGRGPGTAPSWRAAGSATR